MPSKNYLIVKDLRIIKNIDLKDIVLIDHSFSSIASQIDNTILLLLWDGNPDDCELKYLTKYLKKLSICSDIRVENKKWLGLSDLIYE